MKVWLFGCAVCCLWLVGCQSLMGPSRDEQVLAYQRDAISNAIQGWEGKSATIHAKLEVLNEKIQRLTERVETIESRVRLLIEIERAEVCLHVLPEDISRSEEIKATHARWLAAVNAKEQPSEEMLLLLRQQFVQAVQRSVVTESTLLHTLSRELELKEKEAAELRVQMLEVDRQILALEAELLAL
ncbi:MAG: hypothetical protein Q4C03_03720 [bacterium]|nr:hypothetical protein [bacterium]